MIEVEPRERPAERLQFAWLGSAEERGRKLATAQRVFRDIVVGVALLLSLLVLYSFWYQVDNICVEVHNPRNPEESGVIAYRSLSGTALHYVANYKTQNTSLQLWQIRVHKWTAPLNNHLVGYLCVDCKKAERDHCKDLGLPPHCNQVSLMIETPRFLKDFLSNLLIHRFSMVFEDGQQWFSTGPGYNCPHFFFALNEKAQPTIAADPNEL
jgi:hypothetical protein